MGSYIIEVKSERAWRDRNVETKKKAVEETAINPFQISGTLYIRLNGLCH